MKQIIVIFWLLAFSACGGASESRAYDGNYRQTAEPAPQYQPASYTGDDEDGSQGSVSSGPSEDAPPPKQLSGNTPISGDKVNPQGTKTKNESKVFTPTAEELEKRLVKNAYLRVTVKKEKEIPGRIDEVEKITKGVDGYVSSKTERSIIARVPNDKLDFVLDQVRELGKVVDEDVSVVDVTARYVDLQLRIDNSRKLQTRLQELVKQGKNVKEILEVEKELGRITTQLESFEGQMRVMKNQTTYATVSVMFKKRVRPGPIGWVFYGIYSGVKWLFIWD